MIDGERAGWLRCRVTEPEEGQPFYSASPSIEQVIAFVVGGTTPAVHATVSTTRCSGSPRACRRSASSSATPRSSPSETPHVLEVAAGDGWEEWSEVDTFAASGPEDRHFMLDPVSGEVRFGPAVRLEDGTVRYYGDVPPKGAPIRIRQYRSGGGEQGNVARNSLTVHAHAVSPSSRA